MTTRSWHILDELLDRIGKDQKEIEVECRSDKSARNLRHKLYYRMKARSIDNVKIKVKGRVLILIPDFDPIIRILP